MVFSWVVFYANGPPGCMMIVIPETATIRHHCRVKDYSKATALHHLDARIIAHKIRIAKAELRPILSTRFQKHRRWLLQKRIAKLSAQLAEIEAKLQSRQG
jgi:hypothetical protein